MATERLRQGMASILGELESLYAKDAIGAVQINIALRDGDIRTLKCYDDGFRVLLVAAAAIGQREAFESIEVERDPDNWREASSR
jgi:superfamily I DNA and RNA helicase